ncbi:MAG: hypothetical protein F6K42_38590, partial [Leptolyngbya sp. SIO1D8]|nr:hypothetical protein [Leptolyngbya sp. SIO1D8]
MYDPETALKEPRSVVLTEKVARKLFGMADPMGQELKMESRTIMKVTGIIEDLPIQSHLEFGMLASYSTWQGTEFTNEGVYGDNHFRNFYTYTYVLLYPEVDPADMALQLTELVTTRKKVDLVSDVFTLQQLYEIHLYSDLQYELKATGGGVKIWILLGISMLILVLTWANYFNLSVAYAFELSKSIAIGKLAGANQFQIAGQLFIENLFVTTIGWLIGVIMAITLTPSVEYLFEIELSSMGILAN